MRNKRGYVACLLPLHAVIMISGIERFVSRSHDISPPADHVTGCSETDLDASLHFQLLLNGLAMTAGTLCVLHLCICKARRQAR